MSSDTIELVAQEHNENVTVRKYRNPVPTNRLTILAFLGFALVAMMARQ